MRDINLIVILAVGIVGLYIGLPVENKPLFRQDESLHRIRIFFGIDLKGGAELHYRVLFPDNATTEQRENAVRATITRLQSRLNNRGLADAEIRPLGTDMISIQLAGVDRARLDELKRLIGTVGKVEWYQVAPKTIHDHADEEHRVSETGWVAYAAPPDFHDDEHSYVDPADNRRYIILREQPGLDGRNVVNSYPRAELGGGQIVIFDLDQPGAAAFEAMTSEAMEEQIPRAGGEEHHGHIAIVQDGHVRSAPEVRDVISITGRISGGGQGFTPDEARLLADILKSGSLPFPIGRLERVGEEERAVPGEPEDETFVGPSLGEDSIRRGYMALGISAALVALFMLAYYLGPGISSVVSLAYNVIFIMAALAIFGATLTLPGLAALVLTLGMAVDANILIFERMREEMGKGKTPLQAFEQGHDRAMTAIVDSNITTFFAGLVLYYVARGTPVAGFGLTLMIGIITTMASVLWVGKAVLRSMIVSGVITKVRMMNWIGVPKINWIRLMPMFAVISALAVAASGYLFFSAGGFSQESALWGVDFRGGTVVHFTLREASPIDQVRSRLLGLAGEDGMPKYPEAKLQTVSLEGAVGGFQADASSFQFRTASQDASQVKHDIIAALGDFIWPPPTDDLPPGAVTDEPGTFGSDDAFGGRAGCVETGPNHLRHFEASGMVVNVRADAGVTEEQAASRIRSAAGALVAVISHNAAGDPFVLVEPQPDPPAGTFRFRVVFLKADVESHADSIRSTLEARLHELAAETDESRVIPLTPDPFGGGGVRQMGPVEAQKLRDDSLFGLLISCLLMLAYVAFRFFRSVRFGIAAVIPLFHDSMIAVGALALCQKFIPETTGLNFDVNLPAVAAILTVIGYSINDTIIVFDRIRENLNVMKREPFADVINGSVNQTMSRTLLTSGTTLLTSVVLYAMTMTSGTGIANFAFPMSVGIVVGTYSSIFVGAWLLKVMYRDARPQLA